MKYCNETIGQEDAEGLKEKHLCDECRSCERCQLQLCPSDPQNKLYQPYGYIAETYCGSCIIFIGKE